MGRKAKLTPELQARMVELVAGGNYLQTAAAACGVDISTVFKWMKAGEKTGAGKYFEFRHAIKEASANAEAEAVKSVITAGKDPRNWTASATFLERRFPARWAKRDRTRLDVYDWREAARKAGHDPEKILAAAVAAIEAAATEHPVTQANTTPASIEPPQGEHGEAGDDAL